MGQTLSEPVVDKVLYRFCPVFLESFNCAVSDLSLSIPHELPIRAIAPRFADGFTRDRPYLKGPVSALSHAVTLRIILTNELFLTIDIY